MWVDHLLFWSVLVWMLLLGVLAYFAVRAHLRDARADDDPPAPGKPPELGAPPKKSTPLPRP